MASQQPKTTSLRNPLAALSRVNQMKALTEPRPQFKQQAKQEAKRLERLARREPRPNGSMPAGS